MKKLRQHFSVTGLSMFYRISHRPFRAISLILPLVFAIYGTRLDSTASVAFAQSGPPGSAIQATADPFAGLSVGELVARTYGSGQLTIDQVFTTTAAFTRYLIHYPTSNLTIY